MPDIDIDFCIEGREKVIDDVEVHMGMIKFARLSLWYYDGKGCSKGCRVVPSAYRSKTPSLNTGLIPDRAQNNAQRGNRTGTKT